MGYLSFHLEIEGGGKSVRSNLSFEPTPKKHKIMFSSPARIVLLWDQVPMGKGGK